MKTVLSLTLITITIAAMSGCATDTTRPRQPRHNVSFSAIAANPSPELHTLHQRPVDVHRAVAVNHNQEWRMFHEDLSRVWYTDHPTRLSAFPIVSTSGTPR